MGGPGLAILIVCRHTCSMPRFRPVMLPFSAQGANLRPVPNMGSVDAWQVIIVRCPRCARKVMDNFLILVETGERIPQLCLWCKATVAQKQQAFSRICGGGFGKLPFGIRIAIGSFVFGSIEHYVRNHKLLLLRRILGYGRRVRTTLADLNYDPTKQFFDNIDSRGRRYFLCCNTTAREYFNSRRDCFYKLGDFLLRPW